MNPLLGAAAVLAGYVVSGAERAQPGVVEPIAAEPQAVATRQAAPRWYERPTPRLKLSYERFSAGNIDGSAMPLEALHLDMYALSWEFVRGGLDVEGGRGSAHIGDAKASVKYGLLGVNLGFQMPGRITPFIEGRGAAGALGGTLNGLVTIPGSSLTVSNVSVITWMYATSVDAGAELYFAGRAYVSLGVGWIRTTWGAARYDAMVASMDGVGLQFQNVSHDSLLLKAGLGI
jgi:hypothetical protein